MDPRHSSIRFFRKAASELLCKHALEEYVIRVLEGKVGSVNGKEVTDLSIVILLS